MRKARHNLSHEKLLTCDIGELVPCSLVEVLPGDAFRANASVMVRLSPLAAPVMHGMDVRVHHFFVPHRLTWPSEQGSFEDFMTGGSDGLDTQTVPTMDATGAESDLLDYLGVPVGEDMVGVPVSSLPVRAVNLIYNEWYRDQDLVTPRELEDVSIPYIAWEKDYFTTSRPWPQKGEEITLPLGEAAPVRSPDTIQFSNQPMEAIADGDNDFKVKTSNATDGPWYADLSEATAATINSLRRASALQRFAEARARFGSRYAEYVRHAFGATPLDARLQRPEYLGGGSQRVNVSEVLQTAPDTQGQGVEYGVGDMYGHGIALTRSNRYRVRFQEHGYVVSMFSVRPRAMYTNGIERTWLRNQRHDFFTRELAFIGQQQVLAREVYANASNGADVFGWSDRYAEYAKVRSSACGEFRSVLDYWHLGRKFADPPALNQTFVEVNPADTKRIFNEQTQHSLWVFASHRIQAQRVVPKNPQPRLL